MKTLILVRHAKSDWPENTDDFDRPLAESGLQDAVKMSNFLKNQNITIDKMVSSPALRALNTCEIFHNIYPVDVENALGQHPAVHECAVFGIPDDKWGETVQAAVQLRPGAAADEAALIAFVRERLGPVQTPKRIHFHASLPRSPVGKVLKSAVRDLALATA